MPSKDMQRPENDRVPEDALDDAAGGFDNQRDYFSRVLSGADTRQGEIERELRSAFSAYIEERQTEVIVFERMPATELAKAIGAHPQILKALLAACNLGGRALKRDLKINADTYEPRLTSEEANAVAGYLLNFLPEYVEIPTLSRIDRISFIDKEIRKDKGNWEKLICEALNKFGHARYKKRKFEASGQMFELDAAAPAKGDVRVGIDIKRIEARQDIHKRCDEIVNKAAKLKSVFPESKFGAVIYYPFAQDQANVSSRLKSANIDMVVFASGSADSVETAIRLLLPKVEGENP